MMEELKPFLINGTEFLPECRLILVDEPDFGCEGRPDGQPVYGSILLVDSKGKRTEPIEERILMNSRLDDGMWVGILQERRVLVRKDRTTIIPLNEAERLWWEMRSK